MFLISLVLLLLVPLSALAVNRTVDCDGGADFTTIQAAVDASSAGDTIKVRNCSAGAGLYDEQVTFNNKDGTSASPIVLEPDTGHTPKIRFTSNGANSGIIRILQSDYITVRNFVSPGGFDQTGVNSPLNAIEIDAGSSGSTTGVTITGNYFKNHGINNPLDFATNAGFRVIYASSPGGVNRNINTTISDNTIDGFRHNAIWIHSTSGALIERNTISGLKCGFTSSTVVKQQVIKANAESDNSLPGINNIIRRNNIDMSGQTSAQCQTELNTTIEPSWIGILCDVDSDDGFIEYNLIKNVFNNSGASNASRERGIFLEARCDRWTVRHNIVKNSGRCLEASSPSTATSGHVIENNTCDDDSIGLFYEEDNDITSFKNNVLLQKTGVTQVVLLKDGGTGTAGVFDATLTGINFNYWSTAQSTPFQFANATTTNRNFADWKTFCNCDASSTTANTSAATLWVSASTDDYTPASGSPLINAGTGMPAVGAAKDIGALESPGVIECHTEDNDTWQCGYTAVFTPIIATCGSITPRRTAPSAISGTASNCSIVTNTNVRFDVAGFTPANGDTLVVDFAYNAVSDGALIGNTLRARMLAVTGQAVTNNIAATAPTLSSCTVSDANRNRIDATFNTQGSPPMVLGNCPTGWTARDDGVANNPTSCAVLGTDGIRFTVGSNFTAGVVDLSYAPASGTTTNNAGVEVAAATNVACTNNIGTSPPTLVSISVSNTTRNRFDFTVNIGASTTLLPATGMTGITCREDTDATPDALTLTEVTRSSATMFYALVNKDLTAGDGLDCSYAQAPGNITDDALVELAAFTNIAATNNIQSDAATVTLAHTRCEWTDFAEASTRVLGAEDTACSVAPGQRVRVRQQLRVTSATAPAQAYAFWASDNGGTAYLIGNTFGSNRVRVVTDQIITTPVNTTQQLTTCTFTSGGQTYVAPLVITPSLSIPVGNCVELTIDLEISTTAPTGQAIVVGLQKDAGGGVVQTQPQTINIIPHRGSKGGG